MSVNPILRILIGAFFSVTLPGLVAPSWANPQGLFYFFDLEGEVEIQQNSATKNSKFRQAYYGDVLNAADKIQLGAGASAKIQCSNLEIWNVPGGQISSIPEWCSGGTVFVRPNSSRVPSRNIFDSTIPYLISPRGLLVGNQPKLRWNEVSGASSYKVTILEGSKEIWSTETSNTEIIYSGSSVLEPGLGYEVVVEADNGTSSATEGTNGFRLLDESEAQPILTQAEKIKQQGLSQESEILALAYLYQSHDLNAEAIEILEELVAAETQKTIVYRLLGDMYRQTGISILAKERYESGLAVAEAEGNLKEKAAIQAGLGETEYVLGNEDEAVDWMKQAKEGYAGLGDELKVQELEQRIKYFLGKI